MAVDLSTLGGAGAQFFDNNGVPLAGGKLYSYAASTTTPKATFTSSSGNVPHTNPIILDSSGRVPSGGEIWLTRSEPYKFVLETPTSILLGTWDNIYGYTTGSASASSEVQIATAGQTLFVLNSMVYNPGTNTLAVYIDGVNQVVNNSYIETNNTSVTFVSGLHEGAVVKFINLNIASTDASVVTYEPGFTGSVATTVADRLQQYVSVKDFGAVGDGVTDDTAAIQAAYDYIKNAFFGGGLIFPSGVYVTKSQIVFEDIYWKTFVFEGAMILGASDSTSYDAVFKVVNAQNFKFVGSWTVSADGTPFTNPNDPNLYDCAVWFDTAPGGDIEPVKGILNFGEISGLTVTRAKCGLRVGSRTNDALIAQVAFNNLLTLFTPTALHQAGSQAVITYNAPTLSSAVWPAITSPEYTCILQEGGGIIVNGGEIVNDADINGLVLDYRPAETVAFDNAYGVFVACGTVIENLAPFCVVSNPLGLSSPASANSSISLVGAWGYSGGMDPTAPYLSVNDSSFEGKITFDEACNFYRNLGSATRPSATINCTSAPNAVVSVGPDAFRSGYPYWMTGVAGGKLVHGQQLAIQAFVNSGTSPSGVAVLKPTARNTDPRYDRYSSIYNLSTGIITIPAGLVDAVLRIEASFVTGSAGDVYLYDITNSRYMGFGQNDGGVANLVQTITTFTAGQQFAIYTNFLAPVTYLGSVTNNINIYISTN